MIRGLSENSEFFFFSDDITSQNNYKESVGGQPWKRFPLFKAFAFTVSFTALRSQLWQFTLLSSRCCSLAFYNTKNEGGIRYYINRRLTFHFCFRQFSECPLSVPDPAALEGVGILGQWQPMRKRGGWTLTRQQRTLLFCWSTHAGGYVFGPPEPLHTVVPSLNDSSYNFMSWVSH